jgi:hypothetical protein
VFTATNRIKINAINDVIVSSEVRNIDFSGAVLYDESPLHIISCPVNHNRPTSNPFRIVHYGISDLNSMIYTCPDAGLFSLLLITCSLLGTAEGFKHSYRVLNDRLDEASRNLLQSGVVGHLS